MDHSGRIDKVRAALIGAEVDALLVTNLTNVRYLTGFSGSNGQVVITDRAATFFTDARYEARAADLVESADVVIYRSKLTDRLSEVLGPVPRLGVEAATMTLAERDKIAGALTATEVVATAGIVEDFRRVKEPAELDAIRSAVRLGDETFEWILEHSGPGTSERAIALDLEVRMRSEGADEVSFPPIVGSGPLSAHIHHTPSERTIEKGDLVLFDLGCRVNGYCSDLTRTVVVGPATGEQRELYDVVLRAQAAGIAAFGAGVAARGVDRAARSVIEDAGHAEEFPHGLGHGVGLDIHEAPRVRFDSDDTFGAHDVVTVEPGIYLRDVGGIRIEDCVVVTEDAAEVLGSARKDQLIEL